MLLLALALAIAAPPSPERAKELLGRPVPHAVAAFQTWDAAFRDGQGNSADPRSGGLGWGEASYLRNYLSCWYVTGDTYWLDKVVDHFDRMLANQQDRNGDGFLAWDDTAYSVGIVTVKGSEKASGLTLEPASQRLDAGRNGTRITGHSYAVVFPAADQVRVLDLTADRVVLPDTAYPGELVIDLFAGQAYRTSQEAKAAAAVTPLTLKGTGRPGARFLIESLAPEWIEYVVHDGMVTYPIAQFIEAALSGVAPERYRAKAESYLTWFDQHVYRKWEKYWRQVDDQAGAYTFTSSPTERYPNYLLPHNQYLALARAYLVLGDVEAAPRRTAYRAKAEAMARYFQRHLQPQLEGQAYLWNYWDPPAGEEVRRYAEDASHATIDVGFVIEAARRGVVFTAADAVKIARTYTDVMSNGDEAAPRLSHRVDGKGDKKDAPTWDWTLLGEFDEPAFRQAALMARTSAPSAPQLCEVVWRVGGVSEQDRRAAREQTARLGEVLAAVATGNLGFEYGLGDRPGGWSWASWSTTGTGRFEWSTDACEGQHSVALIGESGTPNVVAELASLKLPRPGPYSVSVRYKTKGEARPQLSFIAKPPEAEQQYDRSEILPLSETWREATWSFTVPAGVDTGRFHVRNGGVGTVWYDDLRIEPTKGAATGQP